MIAKIVAVFSLAALPGIIALWHSSHALPRQHRYDLTLFKSVNVYLRNGVCGLYMISMPSKVASRSQFRCGLYRDPTPTQRTLWFQTRANGPYRMTWLVFPFWLPVLMLCLNVLFFCIRGPIRLWRRVRNGWCTQCGYDLRGISSPRCPECGHGRNRRPPTRRPSLRPA